MSLCSHLPESGGPLLVLLRRRKFAEARAEQLGISFDELKASGGSEAGGSAEERTEWRESRAASQVCRAYTQPPCLQPGYKYGQLCNSLLLPRTP